MLQIAYTEGRQTIDRQYNKTTYLWDADAAQPLDGALNFVERDHSIILLYHKHIYYYYMTCVPLPLVLVESQAAQRSPASLAQKPKRKQVLDYHGCQQFQKKRILEMIVCVSMG